jgi:polyisoprenoid-binding protein YceI
MKKPIFILMFSFSSLLFAQQIQIDEAKTSVSFLFLDDDVDGTLSDFKFTGNLNLNDLETSTISGSVASETIDTNNWLRNRHLRNKYFETDTFPLISFKSSSISTSEGSILVYGTLTIKNISKTVKFSFTNKNNVFTGKAAINASDFDIFIHDDAYRNKLTIKISMPFTSE